MDDHAHQWIPHLPDAEAFFSKRGEVADEIRCRGRVLRCTVLECVTFLFVPHDQKLKPVEAEAACAA